MEFFVSRGRMLIALAKCLLSYENKLILYIFYKDIVLL